MPNFVISLDFELLWGVHDSRGVEYHRQLLNVHQVVPKLLSLFEKYEVACTWATVGAACLSSKNQFETIKPQITPTYDDSNLSPYLDLDKLLKLENDLLFASTLVNKINDTPRQEFASHTFCHYYCLEHGQTLEQFSMDLLSNMKVAKIYNKSFKSLVFPRNQFNQDYLTVCAETGIVCYRGNPAHWAYQAESRGGRSLIRRAFRLIDAYLPLSGSLRQEPQIETVSGMVDVPASLFLRPWNKRFAFLESFRLWRIKWSMTRTAKIGGIFHLWWHPHNFGSDIKQNFFFLEQILMHYKKLNEQYGFQSLTMEEVAVQVKSK